MTTFVRPPGQGFPFEDLPSTDTPVGAGWLNAVDGALTGLPLRLLRLLLATRDDGARPMVFAGSSTTSGDNATVPGQRFVNVLSGMVQGAYPLRSGAVSPAVRTLAEAVAAAPLAAGVQGVNAGVSGAVATDYLTSTSRGQIAGLDPVVIVHIVGANDYQVGVNPATYQANLGAQLDALDVLLDRPCVHVLAHPYRRRDVATPAFPWSQYGAAMANLAALAPTRRVHVDLSEPYELADIGGADPFNLLDTDLIHQTDAGHAVMAELLRDALAIPAAAAVTAGAGSTTGTLTATLPVLSGSFTTAGGGVGTDPADMAGLIALFRASDLALADTNPVASWAPTAGTETAPLAQATSGQRPVYRTNQINGEPAVLFTAASSHNLDTGAWGTSRPDPLTVIAVVRRATTNTGGVIWNGRNGVNAFAGFGSSTMIEVGSAGLVATIGFVSDTYVIMAVVYNGTASREWVNTLTGTTITVGTDAELPGFRLGSNSTGGGAFLEGGVAEAAVIAGAVPDTDVQDMIEFLADRYGITLT